jgi:dipeptidase
MIRVTAAARRTIAVLVLLLAAHPLQACTNFLITCGASLDGSTMVTYAADAHVLYGELYYTPAGRHVPGAKLDIYEWDTGKYLGKIDQAPQTYTVVGNMNQFQVAIGETTFGGRSELRDPKGIMDYGSLIYVTLQRAKTARQAIEVMVDLANTYGYYSSGESLSISDPKEVWLMEMISKGPDHKGIAWVARKIPDGYISAHANNARIRKFPMNDPDTIFAPDVISFARSQGYFSGSDNEFSFADAYAPLDFGAVRFCDARVWSMFRRAKPSAKFADDWVMGSDDAEAMPLWIKPDRKLSVHDVMELMRDHFEGTALDMTQDVGAGPYDLPYRWRPLTWKVGDQKFFNERAISTQQTGFSFVSQSRSWLPDPIGGVLWFGVDDTYSTVYVPVYCGVSRVPHSFAVGTGSFHEFTWDSAFWVFNFVSNYAYSRYSDMIQDVRLVQRELEGGFIARQPEVESAAQALFEQSPQLAVDYLTDYSAKAGDDTVTRWRQLGEFLLYKYLDGNVKDEHGKVTHPGYPKIWYEKVADATGDHLKMRELKAEREKKTADKAALAAKRQALSQSIFTLLSSRGVDLSDAERQRVRDSGAVEELEGWLVRAATVETAVALFASVAPTDSH